MTKLPRLSVIVPVYNERDRLTNIPVIAQFLQSLPYTTELLVVDDGSTDSTLAQLRQLRHHGFTLIYYSRNRGKGYALRQGMLRARGQLRLFTDVDLSVPLTAINDLLPHLDQYDIVLGTRKKIGAQVTRKQPVWREYLGKGFTWLSQTILHLPVSDFTCGFKAYRASAAETLFSRSRIERWGFDAELIFLASQLGFSLQEVPVIWQNDPRTKVRFPHDILRSLRDLVAIRLHDWRGHYRVG